MACSRCTCIPIKTKTQAIIKLSLVTVQNCHRNTFMLQSSFSWLTVRLSCNDCRCQWRHVYFIFIQWLADCSLAITPCKCDQRQSQITINWPLPYRTRYKVMGQGSGMSHSLIFDMQVLSIGGNSNSALFDLSTIYRLCPSSPEFAILFPPLIMPRCRDKLLLELLIILISKLTTVSGYQGIS